MALGGNRHGVVRRYVNQGWRHVSERFLSPLSFARSRTGRLVGATASTGLTLPCVMVAWVFFRASDFDDATNYLLAMTGLQEAGPVSTTRSPSASTWLWLLAALAVALLAPNSQELVERRLRRHAERFLATPIRDMAFGATVGIATAMIVMVALVSASRDVTEFIYFNS